MLARAQAGAASLVKRATCAEGLAAATAAVRVSSLVCELGLAAWAQHAQQLRANIVGGADGA